MPSGRLTRETIPGPYEKHLPRHSYRALKNPETNHQTTRRNQFARRLLVLEYMFSLMGQHNREHLFMRSNASLSCPYTAPGKGHSFSGALTPGSWGCRAQGDGRFQEFSQYRFHSSHQSYVLGGHCRDGLHLDRVESPSNHLRGL